MRRRVSMWVMIALVGALAATTAAVVVLTTNDGGRTASRPTMQSQGQGPWQMPVMGDDRHGWDDGRGSGLLPWLLFAIATGTSVGLLIAWSPWRRTPAPVPVGDAVPVVPGPDVTAAAPDATAAAAIVEAAAAPDAVTTAEIVEAPAEASVSDGDATSAGTPATDAEATQRSARTEPGSEATPEEQDTGAARG